MEDFPAAVAAAEAGEVANEKPKSVCLFQSVLICFICVFYPFL